MAIVTRRTVMTLFSDMNDVYSHQVRIVLAEKGVNVDIIPASPASPDEELLSLNPYASLPTLLDRDLVLYEARIIMEYLDERFPHPPLLPVYPVARAESRKIMFRFEHDWYPLVHNILNGVDVEHSRETLLESIVALEPAFASKPYFLSDEFSLIDCILMPLIWRLPAMGIEIPAKAKGIHQYMSRMFSRDSFTSSLTEAEKQQRAA